MKILLFEELECWQQARILVNKVYIFARRSDFSKDYRLVDQITGAAISIMNNISEGWASQSTPEFIKFLTYSRRSCAETQNCLYVALDQEYISKEEFKDCYDQGTKIMQINNRWVFTLSSFSTKETFLTFSKRS